MSNLHKAFLGIVEQQGLPNSDKAHHPNLLCTEVKFSDRQYRFDFAWPYKKIAVELNGDIYSSKSGHNSITGLQRDYEKLNHAQATGWIVLQFSTAMLRDKDYVASVVRRAFQERTQ